MVTVRSAPSSPTGWAGPASPGAMASPGPIHPAEPAPASLPLAPAAPSIPPAPPLPAAVSPGQPPASTAGKGPPGGRPARLRNFNWEAIPAERVRGHHNLWTTAGRPGGFPLDVHLLEQLFGQRPEPPGATLRGHSTEQVSLLDAKKILHLGIFLKQFKRPVQEIIADIQQGTGAAYGAEKLLELTKLLPDAEEVKRLEAFQGDHSRLSEAERFALLLVHVPSYAHRLELLVLQEEFFPRLSTLQSAIQIMTEAALELLDCEELHDLIRLVLKAGNYLNQGGYAGSALGFRLPSLLRLADTKANQPGMDLLHFLALEAEKMDPNLLHFPSKLPHVGPASRIVDQEVMVELQSLGERLSGAQAGLQALGLEAQMGPFLQRAGTELRATRASWEGLQQATATLVDFLCEDPETVSLAECCGVVQAFGERFLAAVQENRAREAAAQRRQQQRQEREQREKQKRRSIATCSARDPGLQDVQLDLLFLQPQHHRSGRRSRPPPFAESPQARERPSHLSRRHTLTVLPTCPEPSALELSAPGPHEPPPDFLHPASSSSSSSSSSSGSSKKVAGLWGEGLRSLLMSPGATPGPSAPDASSGGFRFSGLFSKKTLPEGPETPTSPQASPRDVSALVGFFRRLSLGDKPQPTSQP